MTFGILQRYVIGEVTRAFVMALLTMTIIFVLCMVMAEATKMGLSPRDIFTLVPFIIPSTLPFTIPVSMLFAVSVVYGRLASDNEVIAVKAAGLSAMTVLWPTIYVGVALSALLLVLSYDAIPRSTNNAKLAIFKNLEEMFYKQLKKDREFNNPSWPFLIMVRDVENDTMIGATFKRRSRNGLTPFDMTLMARTAKIKFDLDRGMAEVTLDGAEMISYASDQEDVVLINGKTFPIELPDRGPNALDKKVQERTTPELEKEQQIYREKVAKERRTRAIESALMIGSGRLGKVNWTGVTEAFKDHNYWERKLNEFETEKQLRVAQSFGSLLFVLLGAPVGILFARRDFLSAFISCFVPIILLYYPLMLLGMNMGKEGILPPTLALWGGNVLMLVLSAFVFRPVLKH